MQSNRAYQLLSRGDPPTLEEFSSSEDGEVFFSATLCPAVLLLLLEAFPSACQTSHTQNAELCASNTA